MIDIDFLFDQLMKPINNLPNDTKKEKAQTHQNAKVAIGPKSRKGPAAEGP